MFGCSAELIRLAIRSLFGAIPVLLIVSLISFGLMRLIPGDPAAAIAGLSASPAQIAQLRHDLGLDEPLIFQLAQYYKGILQGDFGRSLLLGKGVLPATMERLPVTIGLSMYALLMTLMLANGANAGAFYSQTGTYRDKQANVGGWPLRSPNPNAHRDVDAARLDDVSRQLVGLAPSTTTTTTTA